MTKPEKPKPKETTQALAPKPVSGVISDKLAEFLRRLDAETADAPSKDT